MLNAIWLELWLPHFWAYFCLRDITKESLLNYWYYTHSSSFDAVIKTFCSWKITHVGNQITYFLNDNGLVKFIFKFRHSVSVSVKLISILRWKRFVEICLSVFLLFYVTLDKVSNWTWTVLVLTCFQLSTTFKNKLFSRIKVLVLTKVNNCKLQISIAETVSWV